MESEKQHFRHILLFYFFIEKVKPTYLRRYFNFLSSHPLLQKRGIIIDMTDRAFLSSDPKYR
ncbi:hypothetical protein ALC56_11719 [Trachymyrmex septentrionalis]|uniref:Helix-turn-helix domain-containing protein n=1 Tax=Trachymyrmex septentrionalis TaxID=34720 RepID=A0A195F0L7_9HYME|nr:hypothetical protein ALC56_11719 [Trachymyrmex septentrionalis]